MAVSLLEFSPLLNPHMFKGCACSNPHPSADVRDEGRPVSNPSQVFLSFGRPGAPWSAIPFVLIDLHALLWLDWLLK